MRISRNGCTFNICIEGNDSAPAIMLSHGIATDLSIWDELVPFLTQRYRVIRYDSRGHGGSTATEGDYSLAGLAEDTIGILDGIGIANAHFVGLSMGGMVGLELAVNRPDRLTSVSVCNARGSATAAYRDSWVERSRQVRAGGMETVVESSIARWFTPDFLMRRPDAVARMRGIIRNAAIEGYCGSAAALCELDHERMLRDVKIPVLFLTSTQDQGAPPAVVRTMHEATPGSSYAEIADAGHISVMEQPAVFAHTLLNFIDSLAVQADAVGACRADDR